MAGHPKIAVVVVAYNSFDEIPQMAATLPSSVSLQLVDNGSDDGLRDWAAQNGVPIEVAERNLGFGGGCNLGAAARPEADFYFFLNPDARLSDGAVDALLAAAERFPQASGFGPKITHPDGRPVSVRVSKLLQGKSFQPRKSFPDEDTRLEHLNGAAMFIRAEAFRQIGGFDENIFMYFEDDDLTIRLSREVGPLYYIPTATVVHEGGGSTAPSPELERFKGYHYARSQIYMRRKLGQRGAFLKGLASALRRCVSIRLLTGRRSWHDAAGQVAGAWSMRRG